MPDEKVRRFKELTEREIEFLRVVLMRYGALENARMTIEMRLELYDELNARD